MTKFPTNPKLYQKSTCAHFFFSSGLFMNKIKSFPLNWIKPAVYIRKWNEFGYAAFFLSSIVFVHFDKISLEVDTFDFTASEPHTKWIDRNIN